MAIYDNISECNEKYVLRIQDFDGRGPFKPGFSHNWVESRPDHMYLIPWTQEFGRLDKKILPGEVMGCGCKTIEQLRRWFTKKEYDKLVQFGYHSVKMKVGRIIASSDIQLVFGRLKPLKQDFEIIELY